MSETYDSDVNDGPLWQLGVAIVAELRSMTFDPKGEPGRKILPESIVLRKNDPTDPEGAGLKVETVPGLLVLLGSTYESPWGDGTNEAEDIYYQVLVEILDRDGGDRVRALRTHIKWQNQISRRLNQSSIIDDVADVSLGHVDQVNTIDPREWYRHDNFVGAVRSRWLSREDNDNE